MEKQVILEVNNLFKSYKNVKAVNGISFKVYRGDFFAFLGPNGAGKSTTIKILTTLLKQDSGTFFINGKTDNNYIREKIGVVFQENVSDNLLSVKENILTIGALYIRDDEKLKERYEQIKKEFSLERLENQKFKTLSGGEKRRVEIARALFGNPEILLLDEPTTGLDPESRKIVWQIINDLKSKNDLTVFLTTHYMEETNDADYVVIINHGNIVAQGSPAELKLAYAHDIFKIVPKDKDELKMFLEENNFSFKEVADQIVILVEDYQLAIKILEENKNNIKSFELIKGSMDDVFVNVVGEQII
ncbi:MAG: ABC transporter ATP-binding protein [Sphaerochaetaceae bacterium]